MAEKSDEADWLRGDWYEKWLDATEDADSSLMATLEALRGRVEQTILAALSDRDVVLEEAAKVVETWRESLLCQHGYDQSLYLAQAIRALKGGVNE